MIDCIEFGSSWRVEVNNVFFLILLVKENVEFDKMKLGDRVGVGAVIAGLCSFEYPFTLLERAPKNLKKKLTKFEGDTLNSERRYCSTKS